MTPIINHYSKKSFITRQVVSLLVWIFLILPINGQVDGQADSSNQFQDTLSIGVNSLEATDTLSTKSDTTKVKNTSSPLIDSEIKYSAKDSTFFDRGKVFLFGDASVSYRDILLTAHFIELDLDSSLAYAAGTRDSLGVEEGLPVFKDKGGEYTMRKMRYNFKTEKAIIEHVVTTQGEGFIVGEKAKKNADNSYFLKDGRYTTCDNHDHPHFYINMTKAKVIPGDKVVTGPAYLVVEDVKIFPLFVPFAFVPMSSSYHSGFLMPSYGEESNRGFFLRDGGYYFAFSDYLDMALTADVYGNGSWGFRTSSNYKKRYKYGGSFNFQHITNITSEKDLPDYAVSKDMSFSLSHRQDPKANPNSTLSASVNYSTSTFDRNNVGSIINPEVLATNTKRSSISYSRRFPNSPFNFSANVLHSQNSRDTTISLTLPDITLTMNRIYPLKQKKRIGKEKWFETISFSYSGNMSNSINTKESELSLSPKSLNDDWKNGVKHSIPVSMNLKLLKYFSLTPNINYTERWYFKSIEKGWDEEKRKVVTTDTTGGFNRVYDYSFGVGTSTKVYTFFTPSRAIFGDKINAIRHVMTPSVSVSYRPDFADPKYGYYDWFEYYDEAQDRIVRNDYSYYDGALYGTPGRGESGSLGMSLGNTLEMKVKSQKDSTGFKKINILESLNFSTSYNFLADSMKLSNISMSGRTKLLGTSISFGATFDPYALDTMSNGRVYRYDSYEITKNSRLARLQSANLSFGFNFGSETFKKKGDKKESTAEATDPIDDPFDNDPLRDQHMQGSQSPANIQRQIMDDNGYAEFDIPWNMSINYSMRLVQDKFNKQKMAYDHKFTADINASGRITLTPKWDLSLSSGYNLERKEISHTNLRINRNLHCWNMSFNLVPVGRYKSFFFSISVNSSLLRDLKYEKRSSARDNPNW
ncbi:MAG TPA: putative LPS assembly protein LptD [Marinilabiliaceae bacterium]|nr:putative LPS assembly protein LptD [Marinilabiliaceae bacterium]